MARYVAFIGPPGGGKSTQVRLLTRSVLGPRVVVACVPDLVRGRGRLGEWLTAEERSAISAESGAATAARERGELAPFLLDRLLFRAIARVPSDLLVALDGSPRGRRQAVLFAETEALRANAAVIHLTMPETGGLSLRRQFERERALRGEAAALRRRAIFRRKAEVYREETVPGVALLERSGVPVIGLDATSEPETIAEVVLQVGSELLGSYACAVPVGGR